MAGRRVLEPRDLLYSVCRLNPMFRGYGQQDAQEFLRFFLDSLHEEMKEPVNTKGTVAR